MSGFNPSGPPFSFYAGADNGRTSGYRFVGLGGFAWTS
jgi:hypothetical protein